MHEGLADPTGKDPATGWLKVALAPGQVRSVFQPIVDLETREVLGYEALTRGPENVHGLRPDELLAAARHAGRITEVDWCCRASALTSALEARLGNECTLFVNIEADVPAVVPPAHAELIERVGTDLRIVLEVTESAVVSRPAELLRLIDWARDHSWGVALDDVGQNPLCLALMPFLEPDVIKLDLRLVQQRPDTEIGMIVSAVLSQAERTGATVLAEGIETEDHLGAALALGATVGQGWLFGRPLPLPPARRPANSTIPLLRPAPMGADDTPFSVVRSARPLRRGTRGLLEGIAAYLEEQAMAWHDGPVILSTFQAAAELDGVTLDRYTSLAEKGSLVIALGCGIVDQPASGVVGTALPTNHRLAEEWSVVVVGPHYAGALVSRERANWPHDDEQRWDFAVTHDRDLVVAAGRALLREVDLHGVDQHVTPADDAAAAQLYRAHAGRPPL